MQEIKTKITPTVHINGTSQESLIEQAIAVAQAVNDVCDVLRDASPNARDYYVQHQDGQNSPFIAARNEFNADFKVLTEMYNRWCEIANCIDRAMNDVEWEKIDGKHCSFERRSANESF
jgi:hypothetical protein